MEIIGGSIRSAAENFLHAGYMSASPRSFASMGSRQLAERADESEMELVDVESALETKYQVQTAQVLPVPKLGLGMAPAKQTVMGAVGVTVIGLILTILVWRKFRFAWLRIIVTTAFLFAAVICGLVTLATVVFSGPSDWRKQVIVIGGLPSWQEMDRVPATTYKDPAAATTVILHGIVPDALTSRETEATTLADVRDEIALPTNRLTPGMLYALQNYDRDGWGTPLRLEQAVIEEKYGSKEVYRVSSAGPDCEFGTADDLVKNVYKGRAPYGWEDSRNSFFIREHNGEHYLMVHRHQSRMFLYKDNKTAIILTSSKLFDAIPLGHLRYAWPDRVDLKRNYVELADDDGRKSLVALVVFRPKEQDTASAEEAGAANAGG